MAFCTLLGIFEAVLALFVLGSMWHKREGQAQIITYRYMMNGGQQIVGGLLAYCFSLIHHGPLKSWQAIFLTYRCFSVLVAASSCGGSLIYTAILHGHIN